MFVAAATATGLVALAPTVCSQSNDTFDLILAHHAASKDGTIDLTEIIQTISSQVHWEAMSRADQGTDGRRLQEWSAVPPKATAESPLAASSSYSAARRRIRVREEAEAREKPPAWAEEAVAGRARPKTGGRSQTEGGGGGSASKLKPGPGSKIPVTAEDRAQLVKAKQEVNRWCTRQGFARDEAETPSKAAAHGQGVTDGGDVQRLSKATGPTGQQPWSSIMPGTRFNGKYEASVDALAKEVARDLRLEGAFELGCAIATMLLAVRAVQLSGAVEERAANSSQGPPPTGSAPGPIGASALERQTSEEPEAVARARTGTAGRRLGSALAPREPSAPMPDSDSHPGTKEIDP
jgi:hypothetical protein